MFKAVTNGICLLERPEEYDSRSLYDRLKEQKMKKDLEYEETHKLSKCVFVKVSTFFKYKMLSENLIRGLDEDEVSFLELVDKNKMGIEKEKLLEEERELNDFRNRVTTLQEETENKVFIALTYASSFVYMLEYCRKYRPN